MDGDVKTLAQRLESYGQQNLLAFWDTITNDQRRQLVDDLKSVDLEEVTQIFRESTATSNSTTTIDELLQPLADDVHESIATTPKERVQEYKEIGLRQVSEGRVAALLLAGGQGTRLGVNYPKGMFDVGLPDGKTLYQLQGERILKLEQLSFELTKKKGAIPWYIMTSEATKEPTEEFFERHNYFGLSKDNIVIFEQNTLPCFTFDGKIILEKPFKLARAPDGNGGLYWALGARGILGDMKKRGIQYLHVYCVDNILVKVADPVFVGYCISKGAETGAKVIEKSFPTEPVGIICKVDGKYQVVEYSEVSLQTAQKRNSDGRLTFNAGNICNHFFTFNFLENVANKKLKHHVAKKKIPFINSEGQLIKPDKPNGIKLEKFVFDIFQYAEKFAVWEVLRENEFSPLKNAEGADKDTPTTARLSYIFNKIFLSDY